MTSVSKRRKAKNNLYGTSNLKTKGKAKGTDHYNSSKRQQIKKKIKEEEEQYPIGHPKNLLTSMRQWKEDVDAAN